MSSAPQPTDLEFPQLWDNYATILLSRQRMLQSCMAYYVEVDASVKALYEAEVEMGIPTFDHLPETQQGKTALTRFNSVVSTYKGMLSRFKGIYSL